MPKVVDITGQRFGKLLVLEKTKKPENVANRCAYWLCKCDCGAITIKSGSDLRRGNTTSCGCNIYNSKNYKDLTGQKFGLLTVIDLNNDYGLQVSHSHHCYWNCQCDCGNPELYLARGYGLRNGHIQSCGCLKLETVQKQGISNRKTNKYDLSGDFGIGYTLKNEPFYFDLEDYNLIKDYCWAIDNNGYVYSKRKELILMHRLVMNAPKGKIVDHIYHKKYDNRKAQLRVCELKENIRNRSISNSSSGVCGVYWYTKPQKWSAEIVVDGQKIVLGQFEDKETAIRVRQEAEEKYFGEFRYREEVV